MKKSMRIVFAILACCGIMAGTVFAKPAVTLKVMSTTYVEKPEGEAERAIAAEFMKKNPDIKIEFMGVPMNDVYTKITSLAIGGELPDIFTNTPEFISTAYDMGITEDLTGLLGKKYIAGFYPSNVEQASVNNKLQFVPWFTTPMGLLYRGDWFKQEKLTSLETWDDFLKAAKKMTKDTNGDGKVDRWGFAMMGSRNGSGANRFIHILRTFGARELYKDANGKWATELDSAEAKEAFRFFAELYTKQGVVPPGPTEVSYAEGISLMASEKTGMMITGPHTIGAILAQNPKLKGKLYSVPLPMKKKHVSTLGLYGFSIAKTSKNKQAAAKYLKFLVETKNALTWNAVTGRMPTRIEAGKKRQITGPVYAGFVKALNYVETIPTVPFYSEIFDITGEAYQSLLTNASDVDAALKKAADRTRAAIQRAAN